MKYLIALMILIAQPAQAEWILVASDKEGNKHFVDMESIRIKGNYRKYWGLVDYSTPEKLGQLSHRARSEVNCKEEQHRLLSITAFAEHMAGGAVLGQVEEIMEWTEVAPSSTRGGTLKVVCGWKP
jgi:hypothetical protein